MIERICHQGQEIAIIVRSTYCGEGIHFFTPGTYSQQLGYMNRPRGYVITPHVHRPAPREIHYTQEVLVIRSGKLRVDFYGSDQRYLESRILKAGDVILLAHGGHGFEMLEATEIIEVKQGPYAGDRDKTHFEATLPQTLIYGDMS